MSLAGVMDQVRKRRRQAGSKRSTQRAFPEAKDEFVKELDRRLESLLQAVGLLNRALSRRGGCEQVEFKDGLKSLHLKARQLQKALEVYGAEDGYVWLHYRVKAEARWEDLYHELIAATALYQKQFPRDPRNGKPSNGVPSKSSRTRL